MEFDNSFEVPLPPAQAWPVLMDIKRIAPCMPGAELNEIVDPTTYKGKISVRLGPVSLAFAGLVRFEEIDDKNHTARVKAQGTDAKGRGGANATASFRLEPTASGCKVIVHTDLTLSGLVAQYGRGVGVVQATAGKLMQQFADALKVELARREPDAATAGAVAPSVAQESQAAVGAKPISGFSLLFQILWESIKRLFARRGSNA
jgi:carbon monoxide dehydrogenase subunit G